MPELVWNETDFLACLEVLPEIEEYGVSYHYQVIGCGMRLELSVYPYDRDVFILLYREQVGIPVCEMKLIECSGTRYVNDARGEYLEFAPGKVFGDRYDGSSLIPFGIRLSVKPCISIRLF